MGWADRAIAELQQGKQTQICPRGGSMEPLVKSGARVTLDPVTIDDLKVGDIVLCRATLDVLFLILG